MGIKQICTVVFLLTSGWLDRKKHEISLCLTGIYALTGIVYSIAEGRPAEDLLVPVGLGILFLAMSLLTRGDMGMGDGWLLLSLGMMLETGEYMGTIFGGMLLASIWAVILLLVFKKNKKTEIPLIPFLFLGYLGGVFI